MKRILLSTTILLALSTTSLSAQSGTLTKRMFDPDRSVEAPAGMTWIACYVDLAIAARKSGVVHMYGGPYLIERPANFSAVKNDYVRRFVTEYLKARPREFAPTYLYVERSAVGRGCIIGDMSSTTERFWGAPKVNPHSNIKTDFIPSFAK